MVKNYFRFFFTVIAKIIFVFIGSNGNRTKIECIYGICGTSVLTDRDSCMRNFRFFKTEMKKYRNWFVLSVMFRYYKLVLCSKNGSNGNAKKSTKNSGTENMFYLRCLKPI